MACRWRPTEWAGVPITDDFLDETQLDTTGLDETQPDTTGLDATEAVTA